MSLSLIGSFTQELFIECTLCASAGGRVSNKTKTLPPLLASMCPWPCVCNGIAFLCSLQSSALLNWIKGQMLASLILPFLSKRRTQLYSSLKDTQQECQEWRNCYGEFSTSAVTTRACQPPIKCRYLRGNYSFPKFDDLHADNWDFAAAVT